MKRYILIILAAVGMVACQSAPKYANRAEAIAAQIHDPSSKYVIVTCHRGDWRNFPENSAMAIESIIKMGADMMELDLKMTKDSVLVLSHDATINRCTNGKGYVRDYTYDELRKFSLKKGNGAIMDTVHIPTLREALAVCKDRICVNVDQGYQYYDQVLEIAGELGVIDQILIKGGKPVEVVAAREAAHPVNTMYMPVISLESRDGKALFDSYMEKGVVPLAYELCWAKDNDLFAESCAKAIASGSKVWVNTLWPTLCGGNGHDDDAAFVSDDCESVYGPLLKKGVSIIQTDRPEMLIKYLKKKHRH